LFEKLIFIMSVLFFEMPRIILKLPFPWYPIGIAWIPSRYHERKFNKIIKLREIHRFLHHAMSLGQGVPKTMGPWPPTWGAHYFRSNLALRHYCTWKHWD
jgi:hypothetical protein